MPIAKSPYWRMLTVKCRQVTERASFPCEPIFFLFDFLWFVYILTMHFERTHLTWYLSEFHWPIKVHNRAIRFHAIDRERTMHSCTLYTNSLRSSHAQHSQRYWYFRNGRMVHNIMERSLMFTLYGIVSKIQWKLRKNIIIIIIIRIIVRKRFIQFKSRWAKFNNEIEQHFRFSQLFPFSHSQVDGVSGLEPKNPTISSAHNIYSVVHTSMWNVEFRGSMAIETNA